jgi:GT2 family glycosyltransferase
VLGFVACGAVVRSSAFLACGGFDSRLGVGGEEALLALDLEAAGFDLAYVDEIVAHHEPSGRRDRRSRARVELRNRLWITWLRRPGPVALRRTLQMIGTGGRAVPWAFAAALRGAPWVLAERRVLPPDVERSVRVLEAAG